MAEQGNNAAALREALEHIEKLTREFNVGNYSRPDYTQWVFDSVRFALSAPARNCDVLSEEAANKAWDDYRHAHVLPRGGWDFRHIIAWLLVPAEGGDHA